jgi:hypothetical protein
MARLIVALGALLIALTSWQASAQKKAAPPSAPAPAPASAQAARPAPLYFYLTDPAGNRLLLQTQFSLTNQDADIRVLRRFYGVLAGLEHKGFKRNDKVTIGDWDKKEKFAKCYIYLEDEESGKGKGTGARVWCSESGISEVAVSPSDDPKHVDKVVERFQFFLSKAREGLKG